jgi:GT2 family glycosyltransferase
MAGRVPLPLTSGPRLTIGFLEPHLDELGGIRRVLETGNRLVERGHRVTIYLPDSVRAECTWMRCLPRVAHIGEGGADELDFLIFNHEPQWYLLERFERARHRVFLALHYGRSYQKSGSWESLRCPTDLLLANSRWTADCVAEEIGERPTVVPTGVDERQFRPLNVPKQYPVLCVGDRRPSKGTAVIEEACRIAELPLEKLAGQGLRQDQLAEAYCKAEVFVVGSSTEGFGFPGLEALACGVPLVTTDNGGAREYAVHEETALLVPPDDPAAMAHAIRRLLGDAELRDRLVRNGLELAHERFSWDDAVLGLEQALVDALTGRAQLRSRRHAPRLREPEEDPLISLIVLVWNQLELTQRCVESLRQHTDVAYELILVDNGSDEETRRYVAQAADTAILNDVNRGFSAGFNQGLAAARGRMVAFLNNDIRVPERWASRLAATLETSPRAGVVYPAVTAAGNPVSVRSAARDSVTVLPPFQEPASAVALVMPTGMARDLGGFGEEYEVASAEDVDLAFKIWVNGLDALLDEGVLVEHVAKASASRLTDQKQRWAVNRAVFLDKWTGALAELPRLDSCPEEDFDRNRAHARGVAFWMGRYFGIRDRAVLGKATTKPSRLPEETAAPFRAKPAPAEPSRMITALPAGLVRRLWSSARGRVPERLRTSLYRRFRAEYEHFFPERAPASTPPAAVPPPETRGPQAVAARSEAQSAPSASSSARISR